MPLLVAEKGNYGIQEPPLQSVVAAVAKDEGEGEVEGDNLFTPGRVPASSLMSDLVGKISALPLILPSLSGHLASTLDFSKALNKLGEASIIRDDEPDDVGAGFQKFAILAKEMANLMKELVSEKMTYFFSPW